MNAKPMSLRFIQIFMILKALIIVLLCILFASFLVEAGDMWESFKSGFLEGASGSQLDDYDAEQFGRLVGIMILPFAFTMWTLYAIRHRKYKSLIISLILHLLTSVQNPFYLLLSIIMLAVSFTFRVKRYMTDEGGSLIDMR